MGGRWLFILLIAIGASSYGMLSPLVKLAYQDGWNDEQISIAQTLMGALMTWAIVLCVRRAWTNPFRGAWVRMLLIGIFGLAMTTVLYNAALSALDASIAIVLLFQFTWITIVLESIASRKMPSLPQIAAIALVVLGTLMASNLFGTPLENFSLWGLGCGLAAAITYSLVLFWTSRLNDSTHTLMKSAVMLTAGLPLIWLLYPSSLTLGEGAGSLLGWGLLLGLVGQVIPTLCFNIGIPRVGSGLSAMLASVELPVAIIGAMLLVGEQVAPVQWLGMLLILLGILVSEMKIKPRQ